MATRCDLCRLRPAEVRVAATVGVAGACWRCVRAAIEELRWRRV